MNIATAIKLALSGISIGGLAVGTGFGIHHFTKEATPKKEEEKITQTSTKKLISEWLKGKTVISEDSGKGSVWDGKWTTFKDDYESKTLEDVWKINDWDNKKNNTDKAGLKELQKLCKENFTKEADKEDAKLVKEVIKYCTE